MNHRFYDKVREVDRLADEYSPENLAAIERLFEAKGIEDYFFRERLLARTSLTRWLLPLAAKGYFSGERNPRPREVEKQPDYFTIPMWNILPYLEKVAEQNENNPGPAITHALMEIVDGIISYRDAKGRRVDNYRTDWFMVKILCKLPIERWANRHIDFIGEAVSTRFGSGVVDSEVGEKVLPSLIEGTRTDLIQRLLNIIFAFKTGADAGEKIKPVMEEYWLKEAIGANTERIAALCGLEALDIALAKMREVTSFHEGAFDVWVPSIETSAQTRFPEKYESQLVSFAREMLERRSADEVREQVASLLKEKDSIFRRLAVHAVNYHYGELQDVFWNWQGNPLTDIKLHHELYLLLEYNCKTFADWQMNKILAWIEGVEYSDSSDPKKDVRDTWNRKRWLTALKNSENPRVKELLERYDQKSPGEVDHPDFLMWSESGFVRDLSPKSAADLSQMSNQEIAAFLKEWKGEERWAGLQAVSPRGLSAALKQCIQANPEKFACDMSPFLDVPEVYQHDLLHGLREAWNSQREFSVGQVLTFIQHLSDSPTLWQKEYGQDEENYKNWLVREVAEFLEAGTQSDEHAFDPKHLPQIEKILLDLMKKAESDISEGARIIDSVLASPRACIFSAAVNYALRYARLYGRDNKIRWPDAIHEAFNNRLDPASESAIDFWVTLGKYIPNLIFLDRQWVFGEIERIFPRDSEKHWVASFAAYLSYSHNVYQEVYAELKNRGQYRKALETDFGDSYVTEKLVQHICIAFLEDWESVTDANSLMHRILELAKVEQLSEVIGFLGKLKGDEPRAKLKNRIKSLWKALFELLQPKQQEPKCQRLISKLHLWLSTVDKIDDEIKEWSLLTAKYVGPQHQESGLVERLAKHVDQSPREVAEIYIGMLDAGTYPYYDKDKILQIARFLYHQGVKEQADTICNMHGEVGDYSLRPLYEEHNPEVRRN